MPSDPVQHQVLKSAMAHHQKGQLEEAEPLYRAVIAAEPDNAAAVHYLGMLLYHRGKKVDALPLLEKAVRLAPGNAAFYNNLGGLYRTLDKFEKARDMLLSAVKIDPGLAAAHTNLGLTYRNLGLKNEAEASMRRAAQCEPQSTAAQNRLAALLREQGRDRKAIDAFLQTLAIDPGNVSALYNLVGLYRGLQLFEQTAEILGRLIRIEAKNATHRCALGSVMWSMRRFDDAITEFRAALEIDPHRLMALVGLAQSFDDRGDPVQAAAAYQHIVELHPDCELARFNLAALTGKTERSAPAQYVRRLFDDYAPNFDEHLTRHLDYAVPRLLFESIVDAFPGRTFDIIDAGCGTGLCGEIFKPIATRLVGVDLSAGMLEKARQRGLYTELVCSDLTQALRERPNQFDLVLAADVFIYVGDLTDVFSAVFSSLCGGGVFAFSIEGHDREGFVLQSTRRYAHSPAYIRELSAKHGFRELRTTPATIRKENYAPIPGYIVLLEKSG